MPLRRRGEAIADEIWLIGMADGCAAVERRGGEQPRLRQFGQRRDSLLHLPLGSVEVAAQGDERGVHRCRQLSA